MKAKYDNNCVQVLKKRKTNKQKKPHLLYGLGVKNRVLGILDVCNIL